MSAIRLPQRSVETRNLNKQKALKNGTHPATDSDFLELRSGPTLTQVICLYIGGRWSGWDGGGWGWGEVCITNCISAESLTEGYLLM